MAQLRQRCPWDAEQTHHSLVPYLVEEAIETVEAIEDGDTDDLREELGDLLLQVLFHAQVASERPDGFTLEDVSRGIADKLIARHPHVFAAEQVPGDLNATWEQRKAIEKARTSVLQGIPEQLSALARATKIVHRARARRISVPLPEDPIEAGEVGAAMLELVARAAAHGIDAEQATRAAVRQLEAQVQAAERTESQAAGLG